MTDEDVIARVAQLWGTGYFRKPSKDVRHKDLFTTRLGNRRAFEFMELIQPHMGARRKTQIARAMACYRETPPLMTPIFDRNEIARLREAGLSYRAVALRMGCHHSLVERVVRAQ